MLHIVEAAIRKLTCAVCVVLGFSVALPVHAEQARVLQLAPITMWNIDWREKSCVLRRVFGSKEDPIVLQLEQFESGDRFQLALHGNRILGADRRKPFSIRYGSAEGALHELPWTFESGHSDGMGSILIASTSLSGGWTDGDPPRPVTQEKEAEITQISFWKVRGGLLVLNTGRLDKAFAEWRKCTDKLVARWGFDPAVQASLRSPPEPLNDPATWLYPNDYPELALRKNAQGIVHFRLNVDAAGKVTDCDILQSSSPDILAKRSCDLLMRRARFKPARDKDGNPAASYFVSKAVWAIFRRW